MADNLQNTTNIDTIPLQQAGLVTDFNASYIEKTKYTHARNAVRNSKDGDLGTIGNEPSNNRCYSAPYKIVGIIPLPDGTDLVFSTDEVNSEIGIGNPVSCSYTSVKNLACLNFSSKNQPITGIAKKDFQKGIVVTFTDKSNPVRRIELNKLASVTNCDDILLFKKISQPCINYEKSKLGNIPSGMYSVLIAYSIKGNVFSDWYSVTNRIQLNNEFSTSIELSITNIDTEFDEYTVAVIGDYIDPTTKTATKSAKIIGSYSTKVNKLSLTDFLNVNYTDIPISQLVVKKDVWKTAGIISSNSNYLLIGDLVKRQEENYQLKAMSIESEYVVKQVPAEYYLNDGSDIGFYRDENYDFYIQGVYNTGDHTDLYHIPGPVATQGILQPVTGDDVYELDKTIENCSTELHIPKWKVENTAGDMISQNNDFYCGKRTLGSGKMGYFQSTENYPDNKEMFGKYANTPIRYHKMPDECKVPRYSVINGVYYINILGVRFKNIPLFDDPDIIGYRILRSDRKGGNGTVIARGILTNMRYWDDKVNKRTIMYSNYNVNYLGTDPFLSETQTVFRNNSEHNYKGLTGYYTDKFSFYSPHTLFEPRYSLGNEVKFESEEIATITGRFEKVYNHPREKLMNQFSFWIAAAVGFIETALVILGRKSDEGTSQSDESVTAGVRFGFNKKFEIRTVDDLISLNIVQYITAQAKALAFDSLIGTISTVLTAIASFGLKIPYSIFKGIAQAEEVFKIISDFTGYTDYVYQYVSEAKFNSSICIKSGNKRRGLKRNAVYVPEEAITIDGRFLNNKDRERTVFMELNKGVKEPSTKDTSVNTISGYKLCNNITNQVTSTGSAYYVTSKASNPNQYGRLGSSSVVSMHSYVLTGESTDVLFGGDCIIAEMSLLKKMHFFTQDIANTSYRDGTEFDYRLYSNIGYSRYWIDSTKYDFSQLLSKNIKNSAQFTRTATSKYNLDCKKKNDGGSISRVDDAYMYLNSGSAWSFFVECDANIWFREFNTEIPFYSRNNRNISDIFRSDRIRKKEEFTLSQVYFDTYTTEVSASQQRLDFTEATRIPSLQPNSIVYSLPSFNLQEVDNWQYFLPANYFAFRESDFGELTGIHKLDQDRLIFLFSKSSPFISMGRDFLELEGTGRKITIGDGGLFAQDPREIMPTDNNYGASTSRYAFSNTHLGRFYPSSNQSKILMFNEGIEDITRGKISFWCKNYMPIFLYEYYPEYNLPENTISGVGYLIVFDAFYEILYITKRDYTPKDEYAADIIWNKNLKKFIYKGLNIELNSKYFNDVSWTLSYGAAEKEFISWHDWHPDLVVQRDNHFSTVKGNTVWNHNTTYDSFCNFYGNDYPFEIEFISSSGNQVETVRSLEYILEVYKYKNRGRDRFHILNENFDGLIVHNSEQISPLLIPVKGYNNPELNLEFPKKKVGNNLAFEVLFSKEENKYRVNQIWDTTKDRGEFSKADNHLLVTDQSGYKRIINPVAVNTSMPEENRKKFRHYFNKFLFIKTMSGVNKFIVKLFNVKKNISIR